jgi:uncharacterized membrane protein
MPDTESSIVPRWPGLPRVFVALSLVLGLAMLIITPPFEVPDEPHHFMRAYQISEGHLMPTFTNNKGGTELPASIRLITTPFDASSRKRTLISTDAIAKAMRVPLAPDDRQYFEFSNTSAYPPLPYVPQVLAIAIGRPMGLTALQLMYLARLFNLLTWCAGGYLALLLAPGIQRPLFLLMLMPMSMYLAASMSADVAVNLLAIVFCLLVWRQITEPQIGKKISTRNAWLLVLTGCCIGLTKFVYLPLTALPLLIPAEAFGGRHRKRFITAGVIAAGLTASTLWAMQTPGLDMVANGVGQDFYPRIQLEFIHQHHSSWLTVPIQTIGNSWKEQITSFVGEFGWMDAPVSPVIAILYCVALLWACRPTNGDAKVGPVWRWVIIVPAIELCSLFLLGLTAYLYWNPLGSPEVTGLQGRYLIPLAPAVIILIAGLWRRLPARFRTGRAEWKLEMECALIAAGAIVYGIYVIYMRFYTVKPWL